MMNTKILLVEGKGDKFVIEQLRNKFELSDDFEIEPKESVEKLIKSISVEIRTEKNIIGIIADADDNPTSRWEAIRKQLSTKFSNVPKNLPNDGLVFSENDKKIGVWIMPNNDLTGKLENFITLLVPQGDNLMPIVDKTLDDIEKFGIKTYKEKDKPKRRIRTWCTWQDDPETSMGTAINKNLLSTDDELCQNFVNWLRKLFN